MNAYITISKKKNNNNQNLVKPKKSLTQKKT